MWSGLNITDVFGYNLKNSLKMNMMGGAIGFGKKKNTESSTTQNIGKTSLNALAIEAKTNYFDIMTHTSNKPFDFDSWYRILDMNHEGLKRSEIHIAIETADAINIMRLNHDHSSDMCDFRLDLDYKLNKESLNMSSSLLISESKIASLRLTNIQDSENFVSIHLTNHELRITTKNLYKKQVEFDLAKNLVVSGQEPPPATEGDESGFDSPSKSPTKVGEGSAKSMKEALLLKTQTEATKKAEAGMKRDKEGKIIISA
jgi:hypothetical protein